MSNDGTCVAIRGIVLNVVGIYGLVTNDGWKLIGDGIEGKYHSLSGAEDRVVVCIPETPSLYHHTHVEVFQLTNGTSWDQVGQSISGDAESHVILGDGSTVAYSESNYSSDMVYCCGRVKTFTHNGTTWSLTGDIVGLGRWGQLSTVAVLYNGSRIGVASERHAQGNSTRFFDFKN